MQLRNSFLIVLVKIAAVAAQAASQNIVEVGDSNFTRIIVDDNQEWLVMLGAKWCSHCRTFKAQFIELADRLKHQHEISVQLAHVDIDESPAVAAQFYVSYLPSVYHIVGGQVRTLDFRDSYWSTTAKQLGAGNGRDSRVLMHFLNKQDYKRLQPWSQFWSPFGVVGFLVGWCGYLLGTAHHAIKTLSESVTSITLQGLGGLTGTWQVGVEVLVLAGVVFVLTVAIWYILRTAKRATSQQTQAHGGAKTMKTE